MDEQIDRSVATIISVLTFAIREVKPGIFPTNIFAIPTVAPGDIEVITVEKGYYDVYVGDGKHLRQSEEAVVIAKSICNDFNNSQLGIDTDAYPGLFYVEGRWLKDEAKKRFSTEISHAKAKQNAWFVRLCRLADDDWARTHQHKMISDLQRNAACSLGWTREWLAETPVGDARLVPCPFCQTLLKPEALVCATCKEIVKPEEYAKLKEPVKKSKSSVLPAGVE